ncbi:MAG: undecaprenyl-phosphate glucose phosphotransferase [Bdellovibrionales bacterium]|nr:undecaprenyl-phosphate glucose phosphotransferase [Bdellovibrionales bacterium]
MLKRYHQIVGGVFRLVDCIVIGAAWLASYWLRFDLGLIAVTKGFPSFETYASLTPLVILIWAIVLSQFKVYQSGRMLRRTDEAFTMLRAHAVAVLVFISLTYLFSEYRYSRIVIASFAVLGGLFLILFRLTLRNLLRAIRRRGHNLRHVLIVGHGEAVDHLIHRLNRFPELGLRVLGTVGHGKGAMGTYADLPRLIRETRADQVMIALPRNESAELDSILASLKDETMDLLLIPDVHEYVTLGCRVEDFDGLPIVNLNESPLDGWGSTGKRITDFILSTFALLVLSPIFLIIGLAVKLTSRGPIFYGQERLGLDGRKFKMYKFRSMKVDAEKETGAVWAVKGDDRRTPIGAFLRSTSLDELPQFWNVWLGEMSLVGPRPERPVFVDQFRHEIPHYMLRHKVKAGITGWAQVNGWRGDTSLERRIECDLFYIRNWSYWLDIKILFLTVFKGFVNKNAY